MSLESHSLNSSVIVPVYNDFRSLLGWGLGSLALSLESHGLNSSVIVPVYSDSMSLIVIV